MRRIALFAVIPLAEISLFVLIGGSIGLFPTLAEVVLTAVLGASVLRSWARSGPLRRREPYPEGPDDWARVSSRWLVMMTAGALLFAPGFLSDACGFLLAYVPTLRGLAVRAVIERGILDGEPPVGPPRDGDVIDADFEEVPGTRNRESRPSG